MEPEGSLLHSQLPATCPYPEPARSNPYPTSHLSEPALYSLITFHIPYLMSFSRCSLSVQVWSLLYECFATGYVFTVKNC